MGIVCQLAHIIGGGGLTHRPTYPRSLRPCWQVFPSQVLFARVYDKLTRFSLTKSFVQKLVVCTGLYSSRAVVFAVQHASSHSARSRVWIVAFSRSFVYNQWHWDVGHLNKKCVFAYNCPKFTCKHPSPRFNVVLFQKKWSTTQWKAVWLNIESKC